MIFSYNFLNSFFKEKLPSIKELSNEITLHAFEVEKPQKQGDDYALDIQIMPDRGSDALSHLGMARECSAILGLKRKEIETDLVEDESLDVNKFLSVQVKSKDCIRYTARVLTGIEVKESPKWLKDRLKVCGISPVNNIVDVTNYVMLELGQPLHAFDYEKLSENKALFIKNARKNEKIQILSGEKIRLNNSVLTIRDEKDVLAIAGIKGGKKAEIDENTKAIVLESANFRGTSISKTSKKIKLRTDSSFRFEHNIDPNLTILGVNRATHLIQKLTGAIVLKGMLDVSKEEQIPKIISLNLNYLEKLLGIQIDLKDIKEILKSLEFEVQDKVKENLQVKIPSFRRDIEIQENLIEEIGRIYGYDKIKPVLHLTGVKAKRNESIFLKNNLRLLFKELGFSEVYNYPFIGKKDKQDFGFNGLTEIKNPITVDSEYLAPSLIPNLIKNLKLNLKYEKEIKLYEIGKIFKGKKESSAISAIIGEKDYRVLKAYLEEIFKDFGIFRVEYLPNSKKDFFSKRRSAIIKVNKKEIGKIGHLSAFVGEKLNTDPVLFELDFDVFKDQAMAENEFKPISTFPIAVRDITVVVPSTAYTQEIIEIIKISEASLIKDIELLDVFNDAKENLKSITFRIYLQAKDRGLTNEEISKVQDKIISNLMKNPAWEVKKL